MAPTTILRVKLAAQAQARTPVPPALLFYSGAIRHVNFSNKGKAHDLEAKVS